MLGSLEIRREREQLGDAYDMYGRRVRNYGAVRISGSFYLNDPHTRLRNNHSELYESLHGRVAISLTFIMSTPVEKYKLPEGIGLESIDEEWCKEFGVGELVKENDEEIYEFPDVYIQSIEGDGRVEFEATSEPEHRKL